MGRDPPATATATATATDFLDSAAAHPNFVTGAPYSQAYKDLARTGWATLPVYRDASRVAEVAASLRSNALTLIVSQTGSGKTVVVPRIAMKVLHEGKAEPRVAITFPKSVLAMEGARYAARTWDVRLGEHVGYQFRGAPAASHGPSTRALFLTDGTLLTMSRRDPLFRAFDCVVLDEAHERGMQTDLLIARLRDALVARPAFRVVVMSATIDPAVFLTYFSASALSCAAIQLAGAPSHPISHRWEGALVPQDAYLKTAVRRADEALAATEDDVLVFVATTKEATRGCRLFHEACTSVAGSDSRGPCATTQCEGLYRKLPEDLKATVIHGRPLAPMTRKLVFATPIAESSVTLPQLGAVVDSGLQLSSRWLPKEQATCVSREMTSKAQIAQRVGRVGRVRPGVVYHMYTQAQHAALRDFPEPAILSTDLTEHFLAEMCVAGPGTPRHKTLAHVLADCARLLSPPTPPQVASAVSTLHRLGLVDVSGPMPAAAYAKWAAAAPASVAHASAVAAVSSATVTPLGRSVQDACDVFKASLACALLLVGGVLVPAARDDALVLACILEEVGGETADLWSLAVVDDPRTPLRAHCDPHSDHVSLVRVYREVYLGKKSQNKARDALHVDVWDRIHERVLRHRPRYSARFDVRAGSVSEIPAFSPTCPPLVRVVAFARRHRQLVLDRRGSATSAGPITSTKSRATTGAILATTPTVDVKALLGGVYDDLVDVGGQRSFSIVTWIPRG